MANSCCNYVKITSEESEEGILKGLYHKLEKANSTEWSINYEKVLGSKYKKDKDYGSRYFVCDITWESDKSISMTGDSAWTSPLILFQELSKMYPTLTFEFDYEECGCDFGGYGNIEGGIIEDNRMSFWGYKFKRDYSFALECFDEEIKYFISDGEKEEVYGHEAWKYIQKEDKKDLIEMINKL